MLNFWECTVTNPLELQKSLDPTETFHEGNFRSCQVKSAQMHKLRRCLPFPSLVYFPQHVVLAATWASTKNINISNVAKKKSCIGCACR